MDISTQWCVDVQVYRMHLNVGEILFFPSARFHYHPIRMIRCETASSIESIQMSCRRSSSGERPRNISAAPMRDLRWHVGLLTSHLAVGVPQRVYVDISASPAWYMSCFAACNCAPLRRPTTFTNTQGHCHMIEMPTVVPTDHIPSTRLPPSI